MSRVLSMLGALGGGWAGWAVGAPAGPFVAYLVSAVGTGVGVYYGRRLARHLGA